MNAADMYFDLETRKRFSPIYCAIRAIKRLLAQRASKRRRAQLRERVRIMRDWVSIDPRDFDPHASGLEPYKRPRWPSSVTFWVEMHKGNPTGIVFATVGDIEKPYLVFLTSLSPERVMA